MKKFFLLLALLPSINIKAQNQNYYSFPDSNANWNFHALIYSYPPINEYYSILISSDTVINSLTYQSLWTPYVQSFKKSNTYYILAGYRGATRQDIVNRKVFFVPPDSIVGQLLYDFSMHVGDTVKGYLESMTNPKDIVESIDSVLVGNDFRPRWKINSSYNIYLIEGMGSTYGLIEKSPGSAIDQADISIVCFNQNNVTQYPDTVVDCSVLTSAETKQPEKNLIKIFPNPTSGSFKIETSGTNLFKEFLIIDQNGRVIIHRPFTESNDLGDEELIPGTYIVLLIDKNNSALKIKLVVDK